MIISPSIFSIAWFIGLIIAMELGRFLGARHLLKEPGKPMAGVDMIGGAVFALCGLLLAFTLTGGAARLDQRRMLIAEETNDIGTAYMRIDLLPDSIQPEMRILFRDYVNSRLAVYKNIADVESTKLALDKSTAIQLDIWNKTVAATKGPSVHPDAAKLMIPALNSMIDITTTRLMALKIHPPIVLYLLLFILGLGCSLVAGARMAEGKSRNWMHMVVFALIMSACAYVILAIEYPRMSFINLGSYDQLLVELRDSMK